MKRKVIISDHIHPYLAGWLQEQGLEVDVMPDITNEQLHTIIHNYFGLVLSTKILVNEELIDKAINLKFIARAGSGMENINSAYAVSKNILVINSPEGNANAVAEHTLAMLLALLSNIIIADSEIHKGIWQREENRGDELDGKTVGIIGFGNTGAAFAAKLRGFTTGLLVYDKYKKGFGSENVTETTIEAIQERADIISFHVPYNRETHHYLNKNFINACKKKFRVINTSRGSVVNTADVIEGLQEGKIIGAGLDVFENEKFYHLTGADKKNMEVLCSMKNVILTPHIAGWTRESYLRIAQILAEKLLAQGVLNVN